MKSTSWNDLTAEFKIGEVDTISIETNIRKRGWNPNEAAKRNQECAGIKRSVKDITHRK